MFASVSGVTVVIVHYMDSMFCLGCSAELRSM